MNESKPRPIAGDVGTDIRIDCAEGHYWVRLVTKQAIRREGEAMRNCLRDGSYEDAAGPESFYDHSLWSLRDSTGASIALCVTLGRADGADLGQFYGRSNNTPSALAYRQLRYLAGAFEIAGHPLGLRRNRDEPIVVAPDGSTYRWDRAPKELRLPTHDMRMEARRQAHEEARKRRETAERMRENQPPIPAGAPRHFYGDGLDPDQPVFQPFADLIGESIDVGGGITLNARANGCFRVEIERQNSLQVIENARLSPFPSLCAEPESLEMVGIPIQEFPGFRFVMTAGAAMLERLTAAQPPQRGILR